MSLRHRSRLSVIALTSSALLLAGCIPAPVIPETVMVYPPITGEWDGTETIFRIPLIDTTTVSSLQVFANKHTPLADVAYIPADLAQPTGLPNTNGTPLRAEAAAALEKMAADARAAGIDLILASGYRSYQTQVSVYNGYVQRYGQLEADGTSARPGFSEHQTGLAADLAASGQGCYILECFETTPAGQWLASNSYKYGFVLRYPKGQQAITGYNFEPWHFRFIGTEYSTMMHNQGYITLEEFLGFEAAPDYLP